MQSKNSPSLLGEADENRRFSIGGVKHYNPYGILIAIIKLMQRYYANKNIQNARLLRRDMTPQERKLWYLYLRTYKPRIYRQRPVGKYILDFYCAKAKVAIEIDGGQHYDESDQEKYDAKRTKYLNDQNIKVIRIPNNQIDGNLTGVCEYIDRVINMALNSKVND